MILLIHGKRRLGDVMNSKFYIYECFFQDNAYIQLDLRPKYVLILLYSMSDEKDIFTLKKVELASILNISRQTLNATLKKLEIHGYIRRDDRKTIKVNRPKNKNYIPMNEALVTGKYSKLSYGAQIFYTLYQHIQEKENAKFLKISGVNIVETLGQSIKSIQLYYKELEDIGLLKKGKEGRFNTLSFAKISNVEEE